jgi:hypothetical protein
VPAPATRPNTTIPTGSTVGLDSAPAEATPPATRKASGRPGIGRRPLKTVARPQSERAAATSVDTTDSSGQAEAVVPAVVHEAAATTTAAKTARVTSAPVTATDIEAVAARAAAGEVGTAAAPPWSEYAPPTRARLKAAQDAARASAVLQAEEARRSARAVIGEPGERSYGTAIETGLLADIDKMMQETNHILSDGAHAADLAGLTDERFAVQRVIEMREKRIHLGSAALNQALLEEEQARMEEERKAHLAAAGTLLPTAPSSLQLTGAGFKHARSSP